MSKYLPTEDILITKGKIKHCREKTGRHYLSQIIKVNISNNETK